MRYELKSIPLWPVTRVAFFVNLVVGFALGLLLAIFMMPLVTALATVSAYDAGELDYDSGALGALTMMIPFLTALWSAFFNTVFVVVVVLAYNLVCKFVGGIELRLDAVEVPTWVPEQPPLTPDPQPEPPPKEPEILPPPPPVTDRPEPPPPVISQPEPPRPDTPPSAPAGESDDTGETDDRNTNE